MAYLYSIAGGRAEAQGGRHGSGKNRRCLHCAISAGWLGRHEVRKLRDASHRAEMQGRDEKGSPSHTHSRHARTHAYDSSPPSHDSSYCLTHALLARMHARTPRYICTPAHAPTHVHATTCRHTHTPAHALTRSRHHTPSHPHPHPQAHTVSRTPCSHACTHARRGTSAPPRTHPHMFTPPHVDTPTPPRTHSHVHATTRPHTHTHTHKHTHVHSLALWQLCEAKTKAIVAKLTPLLNGEHNIEDLIRPIMEAENAVYTAYKEETVRRDNWAKEYPPIQVKSTCAYRTLFPVTSPILIHTTPQTTTCLKT